MAGEAMNGRALDPCVMRDGRLPRLRQGDPYKVQPDYALLGLSASQASVICFLSTASASGNWAERSVQLDSMESRPV